MSLLSRISQLGLLVLVALSVGVVHAKDSESSIEKTLTDAGKNRVELEKALAKVSDQCRPGLEFLIANMPAEDAKKLSADFLLKNTKLAYEARERAPWGKTIPEDIFLNDVLPYANVSETHENWRQEFAEKCWPLVKDCKTAAEAAQRLNERLFKVVGVKYSTKRRRADQSPSESMEIGLASCTGLSILLADACRAVCVPARLVGIPNWVNKRGNHTWIEVWDGRWHFTGAAEPSSRGLNHGWFRRDASLAKKDEPRHAIYAASFRKTGTSFPMVWARGVAWVPAVNVTDHYTEMVKPLPDGRARLLIDVYDRAGGDRVAVALQVIDEKTGKKLFAGVSKDGRSDTNDMLEFEVDAGKSYRVELVTRKSGSKDSATSIKIVGSEGRAVLIRDAPSR